MCCREMLCRPLVKNYKPAKLATNLHHSSDLYGATTPHFVHDGSRILRFVDLSPHDREKRFGSLHFWEGRPRRWESPVPYKTQTALCSTTEAFFLSALVQFGNCWTCSGPNFGWFGKYAGGFRCGSPTDSIASLRATDTAWAYLPTPAHCMAGKTNLPSCPEKRSIRSGSVCEVCCVRFECGAYRVHWEQNPDPERLLPEQVKAPIGPPQLPLHP